MLGTQELGHRAAFKSNMPVPVRVSVFLLLSYFVVLLNGERCSNAGSHAATSFEEVKHYIEEFKIGDSGNYSVLSIDGKHNNLLVGGRDNAFLVDLDNFTNTLNWNLPQSSGLNCNNDRQEFENAQCNTFIEVMLLFKGRILICWTGASPACTWRNRTNLVDSSGKDKSGNIFASSVKYSAGSFSQHGRNTALLTDNGRLFMVSRKSGQPSIYSRSFKQPPLKYVSSSVAKTSLNDDVYFVRSFNIGPYVYFFFRERILDCFSCGMMQVSRVARICKGDYGGAFSLNGKFVTFQKAAISCSGGNDYSLNFNEIQDVSWDQQSDLFYAVFSSHQYGPVSSAICIYKLSDIQQVFDGSQFLKYHAAEKSWAKVPNKHIDYFKNCKVNEKFLRKGSEREDVPKGMMATAHLAIPALIHLTHSPLMDRAVQPVDSKLWFMKAGVRMTGVTVDKIGRNTIIYTSTDRGSVLKIFQPTDVDEPCIMSEMHVFPTGKTEDIKEMTIDTDRHVLYLGSDNVLSKLSLEQCSSHGHQSRSCLMARDPYCGWDKETRRCVSVLSHRKPNRLKQDLKACPDLKEAEVSWSDWSTCRQRDGNLCRCQVRTCQGISCESGYEYQLENCTVDTSVGWEGVDAWQQSGVVHGNWSEWGQWSQCSGKSWVVLRHRSRTCNDPVPRRGGRPCTGDSVEYQSCPLNLEAESRNLLTEPLRVLNQRQNLAVKLEVTCRAEGYRLTNVSIHVSTHTTIDCEKEKQLCEEGEWGNWSPWSECSSLKVKLRRRSCGREPCIGDRLQETACTPIDGGNCADGADRSWGLWSSCVCKHGLNLDRGIRYRVPKCQRLCPKEQSCPDKIQYDSTACACNSEASAVKGEPTPPSAANYGIGHVIGAAIVGCVVAVVLCIAAIFYVGRRKKQLNVSREEENSRDIDTSGSGAKYSTVTRENGTTLFVPPSPSNQSTDSKDRNKNTKIKSHSPIKNLLKAQEYTVTADSV